MKYLIVTHVFIWSLIDNAEDGSTLDLSAKKFTVGSEISIKKAITITGGKKAYDLEDVKVTVKADGVKIENVKNVAKLIADETVKSITLGGTINIVTVEAANSDFKILVASNDVKIQTAVIKKSDGTTTTPKIEAASDDVDLSKLDVPYPEKTKHMELIAMDNGCIQINVKGLPAKGTASNFDTHELEVMENGEPSRIGLEIQNDMEKTEYTYYYPFTKKDNKYVIRLICAFKDVASGNNVSYEEIAQITAKADYKKFNDYFNIENFDKITLSSEYNSEDDRFDFIFDATALDSYKDAFPAEKVNNVHGDFGFCSGTTNWQNGATWDGGNGIMYDEQGDTLYTNTQYYSKLYLFPGKIVKVPVMWGPATSEIIQKIKSKNNIYCAYSYWKFSIDEFGDSVYMIKKWSEPLEFVEKPIYEGNPFEGKIFSYTDSYNSSFEYKFIDNENMEYYYAGDMAAQYKYTYNAQTNKLYLSTEKVSLNYDLMSKEEYIQMIEQMDIPAEALQSMGFDSKEEYIQMNINVYFYNKQLSYEITSSGCNFTGEIGNVKGYLKSQCYQDTDISYSCTSNGNTYELYGWYLDMGEGKHFITAGKVTDDEITYNPNGDSTATQGFTVQYVYDSTNDTFTLTGVPGFDSPLVFTANPHTVVTTLVE